MTANRSGGVFHRQHAILQEIDNVTRALIKRSPFIMLQTCDCSVFVGLLYLSQKTPFIVPNH